MVVEDLFISQIVNNHGATLTRFNAVNVSLTERSLELICTNCQCLEQLAMIVPIKDLVRALSFKHVCLLNGSFQDIFPDILSSSCSLRTLIDVGDSHSMHRPRATLSVDDVRDLFLCVPDLRTIISGNRRWTVSWIQLVVCLSAFSCTSKGDALVRH